MKTLGSIESLWRYPVKSMAGESLTEAFVGFSGFYGDRYYAFKNSSARKGFPYLNANVQQRMLLYHPKFRYPERAAKPPNLIEAKSIAPGVVARAHEALAGIYCAVLVEGVVSVGDAVEVVD